MNSVILEEGPSYRLERDDEGVTLVVTDWWTDKISQLLTEGRADGLDLNYAKGFKNIDLAILRDWPLKRLTILARTIKDLFPVTRLASTLETLSIQTSSGAMLDLGAFPELTALAAEWSQVRSSISDAPRLRDVLIRSYDAPDLTALRWNTSLSRLRLKDRPRVQSLNGVDLLHSLEHLAVYLAPLHSVDPLASDAVALRELHIESCPVHDLSPLAGQRSLRVLNASECGDLASLDPLAALSDLEVLWLFGTTRVLDDDLSPLCALPRLRELRMRSRRSYRPSVETVQALCVEREQI